MFRVFKNFGDYSCLELITVGGSVLNIGTKAISNKYKRQIKYKPKIVMLLNPNRVKGLTDNKNTLIRVV